MNTDLLAELGLSIKDRGCNEPFTKSFAKDCGHLKPFNSIAAKKDLKTYQGIQGTDLKHESAEMSA